MSILMGRCRDGGMMEGWIIAEWMWESMDERWKNGAAEGWMIDG